MPQSFTFEEATQPKTFGWDDVVEPQAPETPAEAQLKKRQRLGLEQEAVRLEGDQIQVPETVQPQQDYDYLPPLPPITAEQLAEPPVVPGLAERFNRLGQPDYATPTEPAIDPFSDADKALIEDARSRVLLGQRIHRFENPREASLESVAGGVKTLTSNTGLAMTAGALAAPEIVLPTIFATTVPEVPKVIEKIQKAREEGDRAAYYEAVTDAAQVGLVLGGTASSLVKLPRALDAWRESVASRAEARFEAAKNITPLPPKQLVENIQLPPEPPRPVTVLNPKPVQPEGGTIAVPIQSTEKPVPGLSPQPVIREDEVSTKIGDSGIRAGEQAPQKPEVPLTPAEQAAASAQPAAAPVAATPNLTREMREAQEENQGFAVANTPEGKQKYTPAFKATTGEIVKGTSHENAYDLAKAKGLKAAAGGSRGYVTDSGEYLSLIDIARRESQAKPPEPAVAPAEVSSSNIPSPAESTRLDTVTEANRKRLEALSEDQLVKVAAEIGWRPRHANKATLLADAHPDDLSSAIDSVIKPESPSGVRTVNLEGGRVFEVRGEGHTMQFRNPEIKEGPFAGWNLASPTLRKEVEAALKSKPETPATPPPVAGAKPMPSVQAIQAMRKTVQASEKKLARMGAMVPPPIKAEVRQKVAEQREKLDAMESELAEWKIDQRERELKAAEQFDKEQDEVVGKIQRGESVTQAELDKYFNPDSTWIDLAKEKKLIKSTEPPQEPRPGPGAASPSEQRGPLPFFNRRSEAQGLGEPSTAPTVEDVRRQRLLDREGTPVPPSPETPTPPPSEPPEANLDLPDELSIEDAVRRQDVMPGRDWIASPEFEFRKDPVGTMLVTRIVEAELAYQGQVARDIERFDALKKGLKKAQQIKITEALRAAQQGDTSLLDRLNPQERTVAGEIRRYFDDVKQAIIAAKQADLLASLPEARAAAVHDILNGMDEADAFRAHRLRGAGQASVRDALRELESLEDWGLEDYITNIERGSYRVVTPDGKTVAVAETRVAAKEKALRYVREHPTVTRLTITDEFSSSAEFPTKLSRGQYFRMARRAADALGTDVREIQRMLRAEGSPVVVIKPPSKFSGPMQRRYGTLKGEDNLFDSLPAYAYSIRKKLALDPVFKQARTDLAKLPPNMQKQVEELLGDVRGRYSLVDQIADYLLAPLGRKPFGVSRGINITRRVMGVLKLGYRPVTALVNRLGGLQHTWTKAGTKYWLAGRRFLKTPEFHELWLRNADYVGATAQAFIEGGHPSEAPWWHPLAMFQYAERVNRPEAFAAFYKYAQGEMGLDGDAAEAFARKATRFAQFTYTVGTLPRILRNPAGRLIGQFKAYLVKEMEFISSLRGFEIPRYLSAFLALGGPRAFIYFLRSLPILGAIGALWALEDWLNRKAPRASRGLPGFAGIDITAAVTPQLPSKETDWIGPALSDAWHLWDEVVRPAMQGENKDFSDLKDWGAKLSPAMAYWSRLIEAIASKEGWITDDRGRMTYKPTAGEKAALVFGAKPLEQSVQEVDNAYLNHVDAVMRKNREKLVDQILKALDKGDGDTLNKLLEQAVDYGIDANAIKNAALQKEREPDERLRRRLLKSTRILDAERANP